MVCPRPLVGASAYGNNPLIGFASCTRLIPMLKAAVRMESFCLRLTETTCV